MQTKLQSAQLILFLLLLSFSTTIYSASNGSIKGTIKDSQTKEVLPFATIILKGTSLGVNSDLDGKFSFPNVPAGTYTINARYIGYQVGEQKIEVKEGQTVQCNFSLKAEGIEGETIVVSAQAEGQMKAINEQLSSMEIKNVVSQARIQELPDANAAESVGRLPGVSILRTGGEGSKVVVRGLSPQFNRVTIDGVELPANISSSDPTDHKSEYTASDQLTLSGDRATDLSMISSNMLGGIEVIKAITPDMDATVFGGVINFSMRKALKTETGAPKYEFLAQGSHNSLKNTNKDFKVVGSYEQRFFENSIGLFVQGSAENKNLSSQEMDALYKVEPKNEDTDALVPVFQNMSLRDITRDRERYGATLVIDYEYETGSIGFTNFFNRSKTKSVFRNEAYYLLEDDAYYSAANSDETLDAISNLISIKQNIENIGIDIKLSHSYSANEVPDRVLFNFWQNVVGFTSRYSSLKNQSPKDVAATVIRNLEEAVFFDISNTSDFTKDRTLNGTIDLYTEFNITEDISSKVKAGGAYNYRKRSYEYEQMSGSVFYDDGGQVSAAILRAFPQFGSTITFSDLIDNNYSYGEFLGGDYTLASPLNVDLMLQMMEVAKKNPGAGNGGGYKRNKFSSVYYDYSGNEARSAAYAMTTIKIGEMFTIVPGVRYQNLTTEYSAVRAEQIPGNIQYTDATEKVSHGYWLPMVHFRVKPLEWFQIHFAYTNTLNYPDYNTIIPRYYIGSNYIVYNNYKLNPARSENFDLMMSFYGNEIGLFSVGGFKKNIKDLILPSLSYPQNYSAYPELYEKVKNKKESYSLYTYINNPFLIGIWGLEAEWQTNFWYLPEPLNGLVLNVNWSHIFSEGKYPKSRRVSYLDENYVQQTITVDTSYTARLLNQPNDIINVALGYDYLGFSMRVSMLFTDDIFKNPDFWYGNRTQSKKYVRFDLSAKQELPWYGIQVIFNLNNISGADDIDLNQGNGYYTAEQKYGMVVDLGLRIKL